MDENDSIYDGPEVVVETAEDAAPAGDAPEVDEKAAPVEEVVADAEAPVVETPVENPWDWAKDVDPAKVRKTFEKFTPEWDAAQSDRAKAAAELAELAPVRGLFNEMQTDPGLVKAIESYYADGDGAGKASELKTAALEQRLADIEVKARVENEIAVLRNSLLAKGLPDFDDTELVAFAGTNQLPNLDFAYKLMNHDKLIEATEAKATESFKANAATKVTTVTKVGAPVAPTTVDDLMEMTDEAFLASLKEGKV